MRFVRSLAVLGSLLCLAATPVAAQPESVPVPQVTVQQRHAPTPTPRVPVEFNLISLAAIVGATKKVNLSKTYLFNGETFGPGAGVVVPEDFPDLDDRGDPIFEEGSQAEKNQARDRRMSSPPSTGGVDTGEGRASTTETQSGKSREELEAMTKADLETLANREGFTVERQDEEGNQVEGDPLKADYIRVLSQPK